MKIKKLVATLAVMPFGIAAALTASGSAPYYGNVSAHGTAAIVPASAQCATTTVYSTVTVPVPVTYTHTESVFVSPTACTTSAGDIAVAASASSSPVSVTITHTSTSTSTFFRTMTLTVFSATPSESLISTSNTLPFVFSVNSDSSTSWINGVSPSSGASLTTATTTVFVTPSGPVSPTKTSTTTTQTTRTHTTTITPPADVSTSTSFMSPDLTTTLRITRTSTVNSLATTTRSSFGGVGSSGWKLTNSQISSDMIAVTAIPTTGTISFFWASSDGHTYSTSTKVITTTLYRSIPFNVTGLIPSTSAMSTSGFASNNTFPSSTASDLGESEFPTTNPGTNGISPASGTASGTSAAGTSQTAPQLPGTGAEDPTGVPTGATLAFPSHNSTQSTLSNQSDFAPTSVSSTQAPTSSSVFSSTSSASESVNQTSTSTLSNVSPGTPAVSATSENQSSASQTASSIGSSESPTGAADAESSSILSNAQSSPSAGDSLTNSPAITISSSLSSVSPSTQMLSSVGTSLANGQASDSSPISSTSSEATTSTSGVSSESMTMTSIKTSASATASPTACGEHGDFVLDFDDLPSFSGDQDITQAPPIFSPYHHLTFSNGYVYVPQSEQSFPPHSGDQLAVFLASANGTNDTTWHHNGMTANVPRTEPGEVTDGPYDGLPAFWFNAQGAWLGCDNDGPEPCVFNVTGWTWDAKLSDEVATYNTLIESQPCLIPEGCQLQHVDFPDNFRGLSGIQIQASVNNQPRMFFMDDLALSWYDNSCEAGMQRMGRPGSFGGPGRSGGGRKRVVRRSLMR